MRIIGGELRGREILSPQTNKTRPMTDRDREAVFNILGDISGLKVLDAYAGSGALGFEALSRGAVSVDAVETAKQPAEAIRKNIKNLNLTDRYKLHQAKVESWLVSRRVLDIKYGLIFADPPFEQLDKAVLEKITELMEEGGLMVVKHSSRVEPPELRTKLLDSRKFGDTTISFYRG